jgi:hypothetical protein
MRHVADFLGGFLFDDVWSLRPWLEGQCLYVVFAVFRINLAYVLNTVVVDITSFPVILLPSRIDVRTDHANLMAYNIHTYTTLYKGLY